MRMLHFRTCENQEKQHQNMLDKLNLIPINNQLISAYLIM